MSFFEARPIGIVGLRAVVEDVILQQMMDDGVVGRQRLGGGHVVDFLHVVVRDLVAVVMDGVVTRGVGGAHVRAGDGEVDLGDDHVGLLLGLGQRLAHAALRDLEVDDLALADLARRPLADAEQRERAIGPDFPDGGGDLGAADFKCDDDIARFSPEHRRCPCADWLVTRKR